MRNPRAYWEGVAYQNRVVALPSLVRAIQQANGILAHSSFFSDLAFGAKVEIMGSDLGILHQHLGSIMQMDGEFPALDDALKAREWDVMLHITFRDGTGNAKVEVPMVPG